MLNIVYLTLLKVRYFYIAYICVNVLFGCCCNIMYTELLERYSGIHDMFLKYMPTNISIRLVQLVTMVFVCVCIYLGLHLYGKVVYGNSIT